MSFFNNFIKKKHWRTCINTRIIGLMGEGKKERGERGGRTSFKNFENSYDHHLPLSISGCTSPLVIHKITSSEIKNYF